jgi:hypothetical protein
LPNRRRYRKISCTHKLEPHFWLYRARFSIFTTGSHVRIMRTVLQGYACKFRCSVNLHSAPAVAVAVVQHAARAPCVRGCALCSYVLSACARRVPWRMRGEGAFLCASYRGVPTSRVLGRHRAVEGFVSPTRSRQNACALRGRGPRTLSIPDRTYVLRLPYHTIEESPPWGDFISVSPWGDAYKEPRPSAFKGPLGRFEPDNLTARPRWGVYRVS